MVMVMVLVLVLVLVVLVLVLMVSELVLMVMVMVSVSELVVERCSMCFATDAYSLHSRVPVGARAFLRDEFHLCV